MINVDKILYFLKTRDIQMSSSLLYNYKKLDLTEQELIILIFFINDNIYNPKLIADCLDIKLPILLEMVANLQTKGILVIEVKKVNDIVTEIVNLDNLYEKLALLIMKDETKEEKSTIYDAFEKELNRSLSPIEYEIINEWLNDNNEEILLLALREATYNGVSNFRYIDRIVHEWNKKGIRTKEDLDRKNNEPQIKKVVKQELFDYDWLNDEIIN